MNLFPIRIKELRKSYKISGDKLASFLGTTKQSVSQWESGRQYPKEDLLIKIADYFQVSIDYLMGRTDDPRPISNLKIEDNSVLFIGNLTDDQKILVKNFIKTLESMNK